MGILRKLRNKLFWSTPSNLDGLSEHLDALDDRIGEMRAALDEHLWEIDERLEKLESNEHDRAGRVLSRIEQADAGINGNIDHKFDHVLFPVVEEIQKSEKAHAAQQMVFNWELYKREDETGEEARRRFFWEMSKAQGPLRVLQLGNAQLLGEFDELCQLHSLPYWLTGGTLIGAVRHEGFVPWDDDVDLGMMRSDIDRLISIVQDDDRYTVSIIYDRCAVCRQIRFRYSAEEIPCFLDVFIFDYANGDDMEVLDKQLELRERLKAEALASPELLEWKNVGYLSEDDSEGRIVKRFFERYVEHAVEQGIISHDKTPYMIRSLDNFDDPNGHRWLSRIDDLLPVERAEFEGHSVSLPKNYSSLLRDAYGDIYTLPSDIESHFDHVPKAVLSKKEVIDAIEEKLQNAEGRDV